MRKILIIILLLAGILQPAIIRAQQVYTVENTPAAHLQNKQFYTTDPENILTPQAKDSINALLYRLDHQKNVESAVVVLPKIKGNDCFHFAYNLYNRWGIGRKDKGNKGVMVLLVTDERCVQIVTGQGLEGDLPDAICKRIQSRYMIPHLRNGNWSEGIVAGVQAICNHLNGIPDEHTDDEAKEDTNVGIILMLVGGFILVIILISISAVMAANKCPKCGKHKLQRINSQTVHRRGGIKTEDITYQCLNCGHIIVRRQNSYDEHFRGNGGNGPVIFGGGGFGGRSGGFSGGSYGGGFSAGGGAGSRF